MRSISVVVIGDPNIGKTSLVNSFCESPCVEMNRKGKFVKLRFYDGEEFLEKADVVLLCFSWDNYSSFENIEKIWLQKVKKIFVLVATKRDLEHKICKKKAEKFSLRSGAKGFLSCSSKDMSGVMAIAKLVAREAIPKKRRFFLDKKKF